MTNRAFISRGPITRARRRAIVAAAVVASFVGVGIAAEVAGPVSAIAPSPLLRGAGPLAALAIGVDLQRLALAPNSRNMRSADTAMVIGSETLPVVSTDKTGYLAGETVAISGAGFVAGEVVTLQVTHADGAAEASMGHAKFLATAGADGTWAAEWPIGAHHGAAEFVLTTQPATSASAEPVTFHRVALVATDKFDYQAGETASITGEGFLPGENVVVRIEHSNGLNDGAGHLPYEAPADQDGRIALAWYVDPDDSLGAIMRVTARGASSGLIATTTFTDPPQTVIDDGGADDVQGQGDLTQMMVDDTPAPGKIAIAWNWDDTSWGNGNNTGDACALFDSNGNGFANYAFCVSVKGNPAELSASRLFRCDDTLADRCSAAASIATFASTATVSRPVNSDPFAPSSRGNNVCNGPVCRITDTVVNVTVVLADLGGGAARLTNVCAYSSQSPGSAPTECVAAPASGFLTITKTTESDDNSQAAFSFTSSPASQSGLSTFSKNITGSQSAVIVADHVPYAPGTTTVSESVPSGWDLADAVCAIQEATATETGTRGANGISGVQIKPGLETVCSFTNRKQAAGLTVETVADPATYAAAGTLITYTYTVTNSGNVTLSDVSLDDDKLGAVSGCAATALAAGASRSCAATYTTTQSDIDNGSITSVAKAVGTFGGQAYSDTATVTVTSTCAAPAGVSITPSGALTKTVGTSLSLDASVTAGTPALKYVWKKDGTEISGAPDSATYTINALALSDAGTYTVAVSNACGVNVASEDSAVLAVERVATALGVSTANATYGGNTSAPLSATLTATGAGVAGKTVTFTINGTSAGAATTDSNGVATLSAPSSLAGIAAGLYPSGVVATFEQDDTYAGQTASNTLTVAKADAVVKVVGYTGTYDGGGHGATGTAVGVAAEDLTSLLTLGDQFTNVPGGTATWNFAGNGNYNSATGTVAIVIDKATPIIHWLPLAPVPQGTLLGPLLNATATGVAGSLPGTFTYAPGPNTVLIHVNPATLLSVAFAPTDSVNYNGAQAQNTIAVINVAPVPTIVAPASGAIFALNTPVTFSASFTDPGAADTHTYEWRFISFDREYSIPVTPVIGTPGARTISAPFTFPGQGVYSVTLTVRDNNGGTGLATTVAGLPATIVVYDPSGGFVTGGGSMESPAGACLLSTSCQGLTGRANFGFVSKYEKGAKVPSGQTQFQFQAGNLNFHSTGYDWLVVSGARAQYKGQGTIKDDVRTFGFLLTAVDGQVTGGGGTDRFRIKIWDLTTGDIVYDNELGATDDAAPSTAIAGGSIVIHQPKK